MRIRSLVMSLLISLGAFAQTPAVESTKAVSLKSFFKTYNVFDHLEVGLVAGSTGIGIDLGTPVTDFVRLRAGADLMPRFALPLDFNITTYKDGAVTTSNFANLQDMMYNTTGIIVDEEVTMEAKPTMWNFRFMVDIMPWENKNWYLTVGFFAGSRTIGTARNTIEEMPSLLAVNIYNRMHEMAITGDIFDMPILDNIDVKHIMPYVDKFIEKGEMGIHVGDFPDGTAYIMKPGEDGLVRAKAKVNAVKPYLGFGFNNTVDKAKRLTVGFDAGVLFWGGKPSITTHEGIDLNDLDKVFGKVGTYVDVMQKFTVYPSVNFRIAYSLF